MTEKDLIIQDLRRENAELRARMPNFRQENKRFGWNGEGIEYPEWVEECDFL